MNLLTIVPSLVKGAFGYFEKKQVIKQAIDERKDELKKLALTNQLEGIKNATEADMQLDRTSEDRIAWADDVSFAVFLMPAIFAFYPPALPHITAGFEALKSMPEWYQYALGMMLISVWGYRRLVSPIILSLTKAYLGGKK